MTQAVPEIMEHRDVWVFIEQERGSIHPVSFELLGEGRRLAGVLGCRLAAVLIGRDVSYLASEIVANGADVIYLINHACLSDYRTYPYSVTLTGLVRQHKPEIFLFGATNIGRDLAGALATQIQTGLTADCTELGIDEDTRLLQQTRPAFGGNVMATILCKRARPQMATVRPRVFRLPTPDFGRTAEIVTETIDLDERDMPSRVLEFRPADTGAAGDLEAAKVIVSGGRGTGGADGFALLKELAELLGADMGSSRAAVDMGWMPYERQVGQTGKTVRPKVYLAAGISGAIQHLVGMQNSDVIIAINKDPEAPILKIADLGIVGNLFDVVPRLIEEIKRVKGVVDLSVERESDVV